jgi:hypothetical protein
MKGCRTTERRRWDVRATLYSICTIRPPSSSNTGGGRTCSAVTGVGFGITSCRSGGCSWPKRLVSAGTARGIGITLRCGLTVTGPGSGRAELPTDRSPNAIRRATTAPHARLTLVIGAVPPSDALIVAHRTWEPIPNSAEGEAEGGDTQTAGGLHLIQQGGARFEHRRWVRFRASLTHAHCSRAGNLHRGWKPLELVRRWARRLVAGLRRAHPSATLHGF